MIFSCEKLDNLRLLIRKYFGEKRYSHTLGVEVAAAGIGAVIMPERVSELRTAALLHDIAKEISYKEQLSLIKNAGIKLSDEDRMTKPAVHSFAAVPIILEHFSEYATPDILSAVYHHTLGSESMGLFDEIVFVADFIEDGREYQACKDAAEYVRRELLSNKELRDNIQVLHNAAMMVIDSTIASLNNRNQKVNSTTIKTREMLLKKIFR